MPALASAHLGCRPCFGGRSWRAVIGSFCLLALACGTPTESEIRAEFDAFVAERNNCHGPQDCLIVSPGCPLGCTVAVRREHRAEVQSKAQQLISDYERGGKACQYSCPVAVARCADNRCSVLSK